MAPINILVTKNENRSNKPLAVFRRLYFQHNLTRCNFSTTLRVVISAQPYAFGIPESDLRKVLYDEHSL